MKLFKVKRTDSIGWDEYDELIVRAENEEAAKRIALGTDERGVHYTGFAYDNFTVTEVSTEGDAGVIVASFNAG